MTESRRRSEGRGGREGRGRRDAPPARGERYRGTRKSAQVIGAWRASALTLGQERTTAMRVLTDVKERAWLEAKMTIADGHDSEINAFSSL